MNSFRLFLMMVYASCFVGILVFAGEPVKTGPKPDAKPIVIEKTEPAMRQVHQDGVWEDYERILPSENCETPTNLSRLRDFADQVTDSIMPSTDMLGGKLKLKQKSDGMTKNGISIEFKVPLQKDSQ